MNTHDIAEQARAAFWATVVELAPAPTGDLDPATALRFDLASEAAVAAWVTANRPDLNPGD